MMSTQTSTSMFHIKIGSEIPIQNQTAHCRLKLKSRICWQRDTQSLFKAEAMIADTNQHT